MLSRFLVLTLLVAWPSLAPAQNAAFTIESREVIPGSDFQVDLVASLDRPMRGFQLGLSFPQYAMVLKKVSLEGTALAGKTPDIFQPSIAAGSATLKVILDNQAPFQNDIPAGAAVHLARFSFHMVDGLDPGTAYTVEPKSGLGTPPLPALVYADANSAAPTALQAGTVKVTDHNVLIIKDLLNVRPNSIQTLEFSAFNVAPLQGFSIGVRYDPSLVQFVEADLTDTITEAVGVEYVAPIIDNQDGHFLLGVLLDSNPPFNHQLIPATGLALTIAKAKIEVIGQPTGDQIVELELADGLGAPPIRNLFVIGNQSIAPDKQNGRVMLLVDGPFMRGDVNGDGRLDISDPIAMADWLFRGSRQLACTKAADSNDDGRTNMGDMIYSLLYLFDGGPILPAPFPEVGFDPTPDDLRCPP
jgi:hypothetical protein